MIEVLAGFTLGLFGSLHCVGMCGPLAISLPYSENKTYSLVVEKLSYNLGRVLTYSFLGLIFGIFGNQFHILGIQHQISLISGIILLTVFIFPKIYTGFEEKLYSLKLFKQLKISLSNMMRNRSKLMIGILNGFIPCGFVYLAIIGAMNFQHIHESVLFMIFFGLGTIPLLLLSTILSLSFKPIKNVIFTLRKYSILILSLFFILHGLSLGIPYLSPNVDLSGTSLKSDCCTDK